MKLLTLLAGHLQAYRRRNVDDLQDIAADLYTTRASGSLAATIVNGTLRIRRLMYIQTYIRLRQRMSWARYARAARTSGRESSRGRTPRSISLLCPTRERVANARTLIASLNRTAANVERIELLFYIDADDPQKRAYLELCDETEMLPRGVRCIPVVGEAISVSKSWNALAARACGDLLLMANDDQIYVDYAWDNRLDEECDRFPDGIVCLYFYGGRYDETAGLDQPEADFPAVTRRWYETLGYFTPGIFEFWFNDRWVLDVASHIGRLHPVSGVFVDHLHCREYKSPYDDTYRRHRVTREKSARDAALYTNTRVVRHLDAEKLKAALQARPQRLYA